MNNIGWIGVDLDGTLAHYDHWRGPDHIGAVVPVMRDRILRWLRDGKMVKIFTARAYGDGADIWKAKTVIWKYLKENGLPELEVTCCKDYSMIELWDDRCVQVEINTGRRIGASHESDE